MLPSSLKEKKYSNARSNKRQTDNAIRDNVVSSPRITPSIDVEKVILNAEQELTAGRFPNVLEILTGNDYSAVRCSFIAICSQSLFSLVQ